MPPPNLYYQRQPEPPPPETSKTVQMLMGLGCVLLLGAASWAFYHFYWVRRLPQNYTLTDRDGNQIPARLEERSSDIVKFTLLSNGSIRYFPIALLSDQDQEYIRAMNLDLSLQFPLYCVLTDNEGHDMQVRVDGRADSIIKYTLVSDSTSHFIPVAELSAPDQGVVQALPSNLAIHYPVEYALTDAKGHLTQTRVKFTGRSDTLVNYVALGDNSSHSDPISNFSALDQAFIQSMPVQQSTASRPPTTTAAAQQVTDFPVKMVLTDQKGENLVVELTGRSQDLIQYKLVSDDHGYTRYAPISAFSDQNQQSIKKLSVNFDPSYPLDLALTDQSGQTLSVRLNARSTNFARFVTLADGLSHDYPIAKLSALDQVMLRLLPTTFDDPALHTAPVLSTYAKALLDHILDLDKAIANYNTSMTAASEQERALTRKEIRADQSEIYSTLVKLAAESGQTNLNNYIQSQLAQFQQQRDDLQNTLDAGQVGSADANAMQASLTQINNEIDVLTRESNEIQSPNFVVPGESQNNYNSVYGNGVNRMSIGPQQNNGRSSSASRGSYGGAAGE